MSSRGLALIAAAIVLVGAVLGVQLAAGGADFVPTRPADPCLDRGRTAKADLEDLAEVVVLTGLDAAACDLGVSRERLVLAMPSARDRAALARELGTDERGLAQAIKEGLRTGVDRLERGGRLPTPSALLPSIADAIGISPTLAGLLPDSLVDRLDTADVLRFALNRIDVDRVLADVDAGKPLDRTLRDALVQGTLDDLKRRIRDALPGPLRGLLD